MAFFESLKEKVQGAKLRILAVTGVSLLTLVQYASAGNLSESITPMLTDVAEIFVPLLALILAAIPIIIAMALISFILGLLTGILHSIHI
jgi:hypothetical protein